MSFREDMSLSKYTPLVLPGKFVIFAMAVAVIYRTWTTRQKGSYGRV
jgi:hypothetical protein